MRVNPPKEQTKIWYKENCLVSLITIPLHSLCVHSFLITRTTCSIQQVRHKGGFQRKPLWSNEMGQTSISWWRSFYSGWSIFNLKRMEWRSSPIRLQRSKGRLGNHATRGLLKRTENVQPPLTLLHVRVMKWVQFRVVFCLRKSPIKKPFTSHLHVQLTHATWISFVFFFARILFHDVFWSYLIKCLLVIYFQTTHSCFSDFFKVNIF